MSDAVAMTIALQVWLIVSTVILVAFLLAALALTTRYIVALKMDAHTAQLQVLGHERDAYRAIAEQGVAGLERLADTRRQSRALPPLPPAITLVPHHESPVTQRNQDAADLGNLRARLAVVAVDLGLEYAPPREPLEYEPGVRPRGPEPS